MSIVFMNFISCLGLVLYIYIYIYYRFGFYLKFPLKLCHDPSVTTYKLQQYPKLAIDWSAYANRCQIGDVKKFCFAFPTDKNECCYYTGQCTNFACSFTSNCNIYSWEVIIFLKQLCVCLCVSMLDMYMCVNVIFPHGFNGWQGWGGVSDYSHGNRCPSQCCVFVCLITMAAAVLIGSTA